MLLKKKGSLYFLIIAVIFSLLFPTLTLADTSPTITRLAGYDRYATAVEIAKSGWTKSDYALLAYGENYPDALAAAPLAYKHDAPILLTGSNSLPEVTKNALKDLQVKNVIIVGGTGVISAPVEAELNAMGLNVTRVFGYDKYDTAIEVAKQITDQASSVELFVVTGEDYPDALSVGSIAAFKQMPIILAPRDSDPNSVNSYLSTVNVSKSYVIGSSDLISDNVCNQFPNAERIPGADKYARNIAVLQNFCSEFKSESICIATGEVFADALTGTAYSAKLAEPILLINNAPPANTKSYYQQKATQVSKVFVFGGTGIIPESVLQNLAQDNPGGEDQTPANEQPATVESTDDSRLKSLSITTRSVMELVSQYRSGKKPESSGNVSVYYNRNGTIMSCTNIFTLVLFDYSQPTIMRAEYYLDSKLKNPTYDELRDYRQQLSNGTYDFAGDPGAVGGYFFGNGDAALSDLDTFRKVTNNEAITQDIFDSIKANMPATQGSNAVIFYCRNADGVAYGKYIMLNIAGYNRELDTGRPFYNLDPSNDAFGKKDTIILSSY